ncbi:MAG: hypothetical protein ACREEL_02410 [Stellaceae bacterium]
MKQLLDGWAGRLSASRNAALMVLKTLLLGLTLKISNPVAAGSNARAERHAQ